MLNMCPQPAGIVYLLIPVRQCGSLAGNYEASGGKERWSRCGNQLIGKRISLKIQYILGMMSTL